MIDQILKDGDVVSSILIGVAHIRLVPGVEQRPVGGQQAYKTKGECGGRLAPDFPRNIAGARSKGQRRNEQRDHCPRDLSTDQTHSSQRECRTEEISKTYNGHQQRAIETVARRSKPHYRTIAGHKEKGNYSRKKKGGLQENLAYREAGKFKPFWRLAQCRKVGICVQADVQINTNKDGTAKHSRYNVKTTNGPTLGSTGARHAGSAGGFYLVRRAAGV